MNNELTFFLLSLVDIFNIYSAKLFKTHKSHGYDYYNEIFFSINFARSTIKPSGSHNSPGAEGAHLCLTSV